MLRPFVLRLILAINFILLIIFLKPPSFLSSVQLFYQDLKVSKVNQISDTVHLKKIFLIEIDDESLSRIPDKYPFSRRYLAAIVKRLSDAKAKVIAVGDYLQAPSQIDSAQDTQLALSFQTAGNVVTRNQLLRFHNHQGHEKWQLTPPIPEIIRSANSLGFSRGLSDSNNTVRKWLLYQVHENQISESLLIQVIKLYSKNNPNYHIELLDGKYKIKNHNREKFLDQKYSFDMLNQIQIGNFLPELNPFEKLSFVDVLEGNFDPNLIRDSIVVIGPTASGIVEPIQTSLGLVMSPIELETYVLSSVLHEGDTRQSGLVLTQIILILFFLISVWATYNLSPITYIKIVTYSVPVLLIADFLVFWLPDLKTSFKSTHALSLFSLVSVNDTIYELFCGAL